MRLVAGRTAALWLFLSFTTNSEAFSPAGFSAPSSFLGNSIRSTTYTATSKSRSSSSSSLDMMFEQLAESITAVASSFTPKQRMTEKSMKPALRTVRRALLDADVNVDVADTLIEGVKNRSMGKEVIKGVTSEQQFIKSMYDELLEMMGGDASTKAPGGAAAPVATLARGTKEKPAIILLAGLQGAGKTTAAGKLAKYLKEREVDYDIVNAMDKEEGQEGELLPSRMPKTERKVLLIAADIYRPAAIKQLEVLAERINVDVFSKGTEVDPVELVLEGVAKAKAEGYDTVIVDTAGRQVIDTDLMDELRNIQQAVIPDETILVVDAMTGQEAATLTAAFDGAVGITGAILTKMDGDSRGGAAVSVRGVSGKPIKFVGVGEKEDDLEPFYPDRMASRILGQGDIISLVEKAAMQVSDAEALKMQEKMMSQEFDFNDFQKQSQMISNMGSLGAVSKMMPGLAGNMSNEKMNAGEARLKKNSIMIQSMTKQEKANPTLLISDKTARSRLTRITKGSGVDFEEGAQFMSEFQKMRTMMSRMQKQMGGNSPADGGPEKAPSQEEMAMASGNRQQRRKVKKNKKTRRGGGGGFG